MTDVYLEVGAKRVFACAYEWYGWCRSGRDEPSALAALDAYRARYAVVAKEAGLKLPKNDFTVIERLSGSMTTDFGAPGAVPHRDHAALSATQKKHLAALVRASWTVFDHVGAHAPAELRKGPRGGGRNRDKIIEHVYAAECAYASKLRLRMKQPPLGDGDAVRAFRDAFLEAMLHPPSDARWPAPYAARRTAWHVLDHAWEMEDRSVT